MATQIDVSDPRTAKALEILADSGQWLKVWGILTPGKYYGVPSQRKAGQYYFTNAHGCTCEDYRRHGGEFDCKHVLAVRLFIAMAQHLPASRPRAAVRD